LTLFRHADVDGLKIFSRVAGSKASPTVLLLHGFPTSSHMFRNLIPVLAEHYYVVAPDLPGFGFSDAPDRKQFRYTFENLAETIGRFTEALGLDRYAIYVFDYGAPVGFRLALAHPERITAIISPEATKWQYLHGVQDTSLVAPEAYELDSALLARPGNDEIQLDLFLDYASNVALYPKFQEYFRTKRPPILAVWGKNDPFFLPPGAEAFKRDNPQAEIRFYDTGHFALETHHQEIAGAIQEFLARHLAAQTRVA